MRRLGELEAQVMLRVWQLNAPSSVRAVQEALLPDREPAYTTVMTVLDKLFRKGLLRRRLDGRAYLYEAVLSRDAYTAELMSADWAAGDSRPGALVYFVEGMTPEQTDALRDALRVALPEPPGGTGPA
ncbi:BlaI/MecI/CopY family transcriptional regulator [Streptomyces sp. SID3343]|uniref:BlaI/MecI/CopY family transcriptional regulator n=1 Tax=Streptomyces sp. SID3343 TaxID=2690260 RepID=UPI00136B2DB2|nr:BlaI/MecI/CopY family transcriptional regulator [Streptomyces sp. SID3343]MYV97911.1 BlaI/MecI/CopY family transcriptional regulator [Streptomyces sp. SID3343]